VLERPDIADDDLVNLLTQSWQIDVNELRFLPLGADVNTAVFMADSTAGKRYFVKLRSGQPDIAAVRVPAFLHQSGMQTVIEPAETMDGQLWERFYGYMVTVQPFVDGSSGFDLSLSESNWLELGRALRQMHDLELPEDLKQILSVETFSGVWRAQVKAFQAQAETVPYADPVAAQVVRLLLDHRHVVDRLVARASELAGRLAVRDHELVLCHGDLHAGNVLIDASRTLHIVDWDTVILAPRERDLMFIGAGIGGVWKSKHETDAFYRGYGAIAIDFELLAYYRLERIVQDIAAYCEQLLVTHPCNGEDRAQSLGFLTSQFETGGVLDIAFET
jgi:spectinomycin phosphotransferase